MSANVAGCDPGNSGAWALLSLDCDLIAVEDMPVVDDGVKGRRTINAPLLAALIRRWSPRAAFVELIGPRPTDAKVAAFSFGRCRGAIEGTLGALGVPVTMLTVPSWRRAVGLPPGASKDMARGEAIRRWPAHAGLFARVKDDGRAEAALIAVAGIKREAGR
jgi:crossover junction endodeoxyribonuclease RuvC